MNINIRSTIDGCQRLSLQVNKGSRHRITRSDVRRGSLWVTPRTNNFKVLVSGEVGPILFDYLRSHFGTEAGEDQNKKYWDIEDIQKVASIIKRFDQQ